MSSADPSSAAPAADATGLTEHGASALRDVFGFDALRPGQAEVIADVMAGTPVVAVMPTGAGKSLCYQLPAVVLGARQRVTLVVSPLIALMKDQVDALRARGVAAAQLTSASPTDEQRRTLESLRAGAVRILYVAPERFRSPRFMEALAALRGRLGLLAIDEAHCISEWGHDFRPDYRRLGEVVRKLEPERLVALTATATPEVRGDIIDQLGLESAALHVRGFARPSLHLAVRHTGGMRDKCTVLERAIKDCPGLALVYAGTRKNAEAYAMHLGEAGVRVRVYHAGLEGDERHRAQDEFMGDQIDAVVATNAFGMGVDKSDIRLVIHADVPRSPEAYYQEAGRGGRDGRGAECVLLFNHADVKLQEFLIDASNPSAAFLREVWKALRDAPHLGAHTDGLREHLAAIPGLGGSPSRAAVDSAVRLLTRTGYLAPTPDGLYAVKPAGDYPPLDPPAIERRGRAEHQKLSRMVEYAYGMGCRQRFLLDYFGDEVVAGSDWTCGTCDVCTGKAEIAEASDDLRAAARDMLALCEVLSGRLGRARLVAVARGTESDERYLDCPGFGSLSGHRADDLKELLRSLEAQGYVERDRGEYPTLCITSRGRRVVAGIDELDALSMRTPASPASSRRRRTGAKDLGASGPIDDQLRERLKTLRTTLATELGVPAYRVFSNKTLDALSRDKPTTMEALAAVPGIGPAKIEAFGVAILAAVSD